MGSCAVGDHVQCLVKRVLTCDTNTLVLWDQNLILLICNTKMLILTY